VNSVEAERNNPSIRTSNVNGPETLPQGIKVGNGHQTRYLSHIKAWYCHKTGTISSDLYFD